MMSRSPRCSAGPGRDTARGYGEPGSSAEIPITRLPDPERAAWRCDEARIERGAWGDLLVAVLGAGRDPDVAGVVALELGGQRAVQVGRAIPWVRRMETR